VLPARLLTKRGGKPPFFINNSIQFNNLKQKTMDTNTILQIIKMIDTEINDLDIEYNNGMNDVEYHSATYALAKLKNHLQSITHTSQCA
jgi:hypothetical protein